MQEPKTRREVRALLRKGEITKGEADKMLQNIADAEKAEEIWGNKRCSRSLWP